MLDLDALHRRLPGVDYVFHEAAIPSVPRSVKDPLASNQANVDGTLNLLVAARDAKVKRVVYAASSSAYGDTPTLPKREDMLPRPISPYATAKLAGEYYMSSFYRCYGLETVCLRYFNVFGPRQDPSSPYSGVLAKFITQMLAGEQPTIFGDGKQSRDFTYMDNVVEANLLASTAKGERGGRTGVQCRDGAADGFVRDFSDAQEATGYSGDVKYASGAFWRRETFARGYFAGRKALGYKPKVNFEEGLARTIAWYRDRWPGNFG